MNIFVISDTHGSVDNAVKLYERLSAGIDFDLVIHCGDYRSDTRALKKKLDIDIVAVRGNCDGCRDREFQVVETPAGNILVTHGHIENVKFTLQNLVYLAREQKCVAVCFGHTHAAFYEEVSGIKLINPGSPTRPRDGSSGSCAIIVATEKAFSASIVYL